MLVISRSIMIQNEILKNRIRGLSLLPMKIVFYGTSDWQYISKLIPGRNARQCRDRWQNYLSPEVVNGPWTSEEENLLISKYEKLGPCWRQIAKYFPTRTDINIKSHWNMMERRSKKEALQMKKDFLNKKFGNTNDSGSTSSSNQKHIVQQILMYMDPYNSKMHNIQTFMPSKKKKNNLTNTVTCISAKSNIPMINSSKLNSIPTDSSNNDNEIKESRVFKDDLFNENDFWDSLLMKEDLFNNGDFLF